MLKLLTTVCLFVNCLFSPTSVVINDPTIESSPTPHMSENSANSYMLNVDGVDVVAEENVFPVDHGRYITYATLAAFSDKTTELDSIKRYKCYEVIKESGNEYQYKILVKWTRDDNVAYCIRVFDCAKVSVFTCEGDHLDAMLHLFDSIEYTGKENPSVQDAYDTYFSKRVDEAIFPFYTGNASKYVYDDGNISYDFYFKDVDVSEYVLKQNNIFDTIKTIYYYYTFPEHYELDNNRSIATKNERYFSYSYILKDGWHFQHIWLGTNIEAEPQDVKLVYELILNKALEENK